MVKIKFSNRTLYTFIAILILIAIIGVTYAIAPNPGHVAGDTIGVCKSDGTNCPSFEPTKTFYHFRNGNDAYRLPGSDGFRKIIMPSKEVIEQEQGVLGGEIPLIELGSVGSGFLDWCELFKIDEPHDLCTLIGQYKGSHYVYPDSVDSKQWNIILDDKDYTGIYVMCLDW